MSNYLKQAGKLAEQLVASHYINSGHRIIERNFTMRWGELDIIAENADELIFVEVKAVHHTDDLHNYITPTKLWALQRTIEYYLYKHPSKKPIRLDIAFVRWNTIFSIYRNVTNN